MQDRYAGDIGDFGKFGLLKAIERQKLTIGINWYLTYPAQNEIKRADGNKPIDKEYSFCDRTLYNELCQVFGMPDRSVQELEKRRLLQSAVYYREPVKTGAERQQWHEDAMQVLAGADIVFLDPDNGLITETARKTSRHKVKYVLKDEIKGYLEKEKVVIFYQHRPRKKESLYFSEMCNRLRTICGGSLCEIMSMTFRRGTVRDYFMLCPQGKYFEQIKTAGLEMINSTWGRSPSTRRERMAKNCRGQRPRRPAAGSRPRPTVCL